MLGGLLVKNRGVRETPSHAVAVQLPCHFRGLGSALSWAGPPTGSAAATGGNPLARHLQRLAQGGAERLPHVGQLMPRIAPQASKPCGQVFHIKVIST